MVELRGIDAMAERNGVSGMGFIVEGDGVWNRNIIQQ